MCFAPAVVAEMQYSEVIAAIDGYYSEMQQRNEFTRRLQWEIARQQTLELLNIQLQAKHRIKSPQKLWRFDWDEVKKEVWDKAKIDRFNEIFPQNLN